MMPFILMIFKKVRNNEADSTMIEHNERVRTLMDAAHDKSAQYMSMM